MIKVTPKWQVKGKQPHFLTLIAPENGPKSKSSAKPQLLRVEATLSRHTLGRRQALQLGAPKPGGISGVGEDMGGSIFRGTNLGVAWKKHKKWVPTPKKTDPCGCQKRDWDPNKCGFNLLVSL